MEQISDKVDHSENSYIGCLEWYWFYEEAQDVLMGLYLRSYADGGDISKLMGGAIDEAEAAVVYAWEKFIGLANILKKPLT